MKDVFRQKRTTFSPEILDLSSFPFDMEGTPRDISSAEKFLNEIRQKHEIPIHTFLFSRLFVDDDQSSPEELQNNNNNNKETDENTLKNENNENVNSSLSSNNISERISEVEQSISKSHYKNALLFLLIQKAVNTFLNSKEGEEYEK